MKIFKLLLLALFARCALQNVHAAVPESRYVSNSASGALPPPPPTPIASSESTTSASPVEAETAEGESGILGVLNNCPAPQGGIIAGAGLYIMQARFDNNLAFGVQGTSNRSNGAIPPGSPGTVRGRAYRHRSQHGSRPADLARLFERRWLGSAHSLLVFSRRD